MPGERPLAIAAFAISIATFQLNIIWFPFQKARSEQIRLSLDLRRRHTAEMQQHLDTLYSYKRSHGSDYFLHWQSRYQPDADMGSTEKEVDTARRILAAYWDEVLECYDSGALPSGSQLPQWLPRGPFWVPKDMLSGKFLRNAEGYMCLVEPIDCANWYRIGIHEQTGKSGMTKGDYSYDHQMRPGRYSMIEQHLDQQVTKEWHEKLQSIAKACKDNLTPPKPAEV